MDATLLRRNHLLWRAGFGPALRQISEKKSNEFYLKTLLAEYSYQPLAVKIPTSISEYDGKKITGNQMLRKELMKENRRIILEINNRFLQQMVSGEDQLREKMAFFWHGHFACRSANAVFGLDLLETVRKLALSNFRDLLFAVSKSPAMLQFLNNQQNKKGHPNENFAREVMELFTMGRGNYSERDVQEAARAFTGWSFIPQQGFVERPKVHDTGIKTFLGKTGNFNGDDILNIILDQKTTANFIVSKIYRFFVNEKIDDRIISDLSKNFYESGYDIRHLMTRIFSSDWFYLKENIGTKIKSPVELMAGMMRILPMEISKPQNMIVYQKLLGQTLLYPPNVAGWPSGKSWIDSSTLMLRLQLPQIWSGLRPLDLEPKSDDDVEMGMKSENRKTAGFKDANMIIHWDLVEQNFKNKNIAAELLQTGYLSIDKMVSNFSEKTIKQEIISTMSTPEYQMM